MVTLSRQCCRVPNCTSIHLLPVYIHRPRFKLIKSGKGIILVLNNVNDTATNPISDTSIIPLTGKCNKRQTLLATDMILYSTVHSEPRLANSSFKFLNKIYYLFAQMNTMGVKNWKSLLFQNQPKMVEFFAPIVS